MTGDGILPLMIRLPGFEDQRVEFSNIEILPAKHFLGETRLEELPARETGEHVPNSLGMSEIRRERVDRLEAAVADVGRSLQTVDEDLVHVWRASNLEVYTEPFDDVPDVRFGLVRDEAVVQEEGERLQPELVK